MKVLWLSKTPGLYPINRKIVGYNGGGWISSLQKLLLLDSDIDLGVVFISSERLDSIQEQNYFVFLLLDWIILGRKLEQMNQHN